MGQLASTIRRLVMTGQYVIGQHAAERLDERGVLEWQLVDGIEHATLLEERPKSLPNPSAEFLQILADGTDVKAVRSHVISVDLAKFVTVHFIEE